jgi:hypothetical protein
MCFLAAAGVVDIHNIAVHIEFAVNESEAFLQQLEQAEPRPSR